MRQGSSAPRPRDRLHDQRSARVRACFRRPARLKTGDRILVAVKNGRQSRHMYRGNREVGASVEAIRGRDDGSVDRSAVPNDR